jgi:glycyl-tRNA synthetase beta chain
MPELLIEIFSEEIPARMQARAGDDLKRLVTDGLVEAGLTYAGARALTTPRRLVLVVDGLLDASPTTREERKGPRVDAPEKALEGFLRSTGLTKDQLQARDDKKGQVWFASIERAGRPADVIVAEVLGAAIRGFPWPKSMRWGDGPLRWVRPLHSILAILSDEGGARVVALDLDGIRAGDRTQGHRFMGAGAFSVASYEDYAAKLKRAHVLLDPVERAEHIWNDATNLAFAQGLEVVEDKGLLSEVAGLVEWPVVLMGDIGAEYLDLPPEVLQTSMREHQKFFSVKNPKTGRIEKFITVANRETDDDGAAILAGNQKVLAARLADAKFFWENDLRVARDGMQPWLDQLQNVTFHAKLGTQAERIDRIVALSRELAPAVGADPDAAAEAARVAKADLASEMVYEFPELQGVMGRYYAKAAGLGDAVAAAAQDHYAPLGPSDDVPTAPVSIAVALADKIDTLTGFWAIDEKPTGSKDPFALRRAALGVIRLVLENGIEIQLREYLAYQLEWHFSNLDWPLQMEIMQQEQDAATQLGVTLEKFHELKKRLKSPEQQKDEAIRIQQFFENVDWSKIKNPEDNLLSFLHDRLKVYLRDRGIRHDVIDACIAMPGNDDLTLLVKRAEALQSTLGTEDGENLVQGFKRANNILTQAEEKDGVSYEYGPDRKFADDPAETALFDALDTAEAAIAPAMQAEDFAAAMSAMAALRAPIDAFFEAVQINTDNAVVRRNRLNLLHRIRETCLKVADLTRIEG